MPHPPTAWPSGPFVSKDHHDRAEVSHGRLAVEQAKDNGSSFLTSTARAAAKEKGGRRSRIVLVQVYSYYLSYKLHPARSVRPFRRVRGGFQDAKDSCKTKGAGFIHAQAWPARPVQSFHFDARTRTCQGKQWEVGWNISRDVLMIADWRIFGWFDRPHFVVPVEHEFLSDVRTSAFVVDVCPPGCEHSSVRSRSTAPSTSTSRARRLQSMHHRQGPSMAEPSCWPRRQRRAPERALVGSFSVPRSP